MTYNPFAGLPPLTMSPLGAALALLCAWPAAVLLFQPDATTERAPEPEPSFAQDPAR